MQINDFIFNVELEDVLAELRNQLVLNRIEYLQKEPKRSGNSLQIQCPYHGDGKERNRSAGIRKSDGMFHCFACNEVHSLPEVISHCFGRQEDKAGVWGWKWLLKNFAVVRVEERKDVALDFDRSLGKDRCRSIDRGTDVHYITEEELDGYRYIHPYMYKRKLTDDIIELFDVGYDRKTKCITFPVRDIDGRCLFIARRSVCTKYFNYPAGAQKPVYGLYELHCAGKDSDDVVICESMIDALTVWVYGGVAVALNGLGNELQFEQLRKLPCRKVILATDNDVAGQHARERLRKQLKGKIITEYILPKGRKDINELTKEEFMELQEVF